MKSCLRLVRPISALRFDRRKRPHSLILGRTTSYECFSGGNLTLPVAPPIQHNPLLSLGGYPVVFLGHLGSTSWAAVAPKRGFQNWGFPFAKDVVPVEEKEAWLKSLIARESPPFADTEAYLVVLRALARSKLPDAPLRAERWLRRLEKAAESQEPLLCKPTTECYRLVIEAWAAAGHEEDPRRPVVRAELWLRKHLHNSDESLRPDTACFNAFLDACSKGRGLKSGKDKVMVTENAQKAQITLEYMIKERQMNGPGSRVSPDTDSFNYVIRAWTRCRRSLDIADRTMESLRMLERYQNSVDSSVRPNSKSFAMVMDSIATKAKIKAVRCRNNKRIRSDPNHNGQVEIKLLKDTLAFMKNEGDPSLNPGTAHYNNLISAWANLASFHEDAPFETERVLQQMISLKDSGNDEAAPDARSYMLVMRAWVNSQKPSRGSRVAWWLSKLWKDYDFEGREDLCPTTEVYNIAIRSWSNLGNPMEAEALLTELMKLSESGRSKKATPNSESFAILIRAWLDVAERGSEGALRKAIEWLDVFADLEQRNEKFTTNADLYSGILAAARKCASQFPQTLELAVEVFDKLRNSHHATKCLDYSRMLQVALLALSKPENDRARELFILQLVEECCEDGLVSSAFLRALANGPTFADGWTIEESTRLCTQLFPDWPLPASWTRNTPASKESGLLPKRSDLVRTMFRPSFHGHDPYRERNQFEGR